MIQNLLHLLYIRRLAEVNDCKCRARRSWRTASSSTWKRIPSAQGFGDDAQLLGGDDYIRPSSSIRGHCERWIVGRNCHGYHTSQGHQARPITRIIRINAVSPPELSGLSTCAGNSSMVKNPSALPHRFLTTTPTCLPHFYTPEHKPNEGSLRCGPSASYRSHSPVGVANDARHIPTSGGRDDADTAPFLSRESGMTWPDIRG